MGIINKKCQLRDETTEDRRKTRVTQTSWDALIAPELCLKTKLSSVSKWDRWSTYHPEEILETTMLTIQPTSVCQRSMWSLLTVSHAPFMLVLSVSDHPKPELVAREKDSSGIQRSWDTLRTLKPLQELLPFLLLIQPSSRNSSAVETEMVVSETETEQFLFNGPKSLSEQSSDSKSAKIWVSGWVDFCCIYEARSKESKILLSPKHRILPWKLWMYLLSSEKGWSVS